MAFGGASRGAKLLAAALLLGLCFQLMACAAAVTPTATEIPAATNAPAATEAPKAQAIVAPEYGVVPENGGFRAHIGAVSAWFPQEPTMKAAGVEWTYALTGEGGNGLQLAYSADGYRVSTWMAVPAADWGEAARQAFDSQTPPEASMLWTPLALPEGASGWHAVLFKDNLPQQGAVLLIAKGYDMWMVGNSGDGVPLAEDAFLRTVRVDDAEVAALTAAEVTEAAQ